MVSSKKRKLEGQDPCKLISVRWLTKFLDTAYIEPVENGVGGVYRACAPLKIESEDEYW